MASSSFGSCDSVRCVLFPDVRRQADLGFTAKQDTSAGMNCGPSPRHPTPSVPQTIRFPEAHALLAPKTRGGGDTPFRACQIRTVAELEGPSGPPHATPSFHSSGNRTPRLSNCPEVAQPINGRAHVGIPRPRTGPETAGRVEKIYEMPMCASGIWGPWSGGCSWKSPLEALPQVRFVPAVPGCSAHLRCVAQCWHL